MKKFIVPPKHIDKGLCWKYALACILGVNPKLVPDFMADNTKDSVDNTRTWMKKKFGKSLVYVPIREFFENAHTDRNNPQGGPDGYSIMVMSTVEDELVEHVVIAKDGKFFYDPNPDVKQFLDYGHPTGFFVVHKI